MVCDLWLVDFDPFSVFSRFVACDGNYNDSREKRNCEGGFWTLEFACLWKALYDFIFEFQFRTYLGLS